MLCTRVIRSFRDIEVALNAGDEVVPIGLIINLHVVLAVASKLWRIWSRLHTSKTLVHIFDLLFQCFVVALDFADSHMQEQCCLLAHTVVSIATFILPMAGCVLYFGSMKDLPYLTNFQSE